MECEAAKVHEFLGFSLGLHPPCREAGKNNAPIVRKRALMSICVPSETTAHVHHPPIITIIVLPHPHLQPPHPPIIMMMRFTMTLIMSMHTLMLCARIVKRHKHVDDPLMISYADMCTTTHTVFNPAA